MARANHATDGSGDKGARKFFGFGRDRASVGGHDPEFKLAAEIPRAIRYLLELPARRLRRVGFDRDGVEPGEILHDWIEFARQIDRHLIVFAPHLLFSDHLDRLFVRRVDVGEEQVDDQTLDVLGEEFLHRAFCFMLVKRNSFGPEKIDATAHPSDSIARHQRWVVAMRGDF